MQIVSYKSALISGHLSQMLESADMIYRIAMEAENAFWDMLKQQCDARIYTAPPDLMAQDILNTLPYHLNYFMERFALIVDETFVPIADFSSGTYPFYVRRGFVPDSADPIEEGVPTIFPIKGYMSYVPFGEAFIRLLFGVTHLIRRWLQDHDERASLPFVRGTSMKTMYNQIHSLLENHVSTNFAGVATPRYISQYNDNPAFLPGFMAEEVLYYCRICEFKLKDGFYEADLYVNQAEDMLDSIFNDNWVFIENLDSKDEHSEFLKGSVFSADAADGLSGTTIKLRPALTDTDLEFFEFFTNHLKPGTVMHTNVTRIPGNGYILRDIGKVTLLDKGEPVE